MGIIAIFIIIIVSFPETTRHLKNIRLEYFLLKENLDACFA